MTVIRRPRNEISRNRQWAEMAADLLDEGMTDAEVAAELRARLPEAAISARTVGSFRNAEYAPIARKRMDRREAARRVHLVLSGSGGTYAQAGQELLAKMLYDMLDSAEDLSAKELIDAGKTFAKIREIDIAQMKAEFEQARRKAAEDIRDAVQDKTLSSEDLVSMVDELMGLKR
jgi:hypothetical protein